MMVAEYKRNYNHSYMILEDDENRTNYEEKMLLHNNLRSLLVLEIMTSDEKKQYWYDITGRESLKNYLDYENLGFEEMETLFQYLIYSIKETEEYLLDPGHILLSIDGIFFDRNTKTPLFAYFPFEENTFQDSMREFIEELLRSMNHDDTLFVSAMYEIYEKVLGENFTIDELLQILKNKNPNIENATDDIWMRDEKTLSGINSEKKKEKNVPVFDFDKVKEMEHLDFDLEPPKTKSLFSFRKKEKNTNRTQRHSKRKEQEDFVMYVEETEPEEKNETVLLTGPFLAESLTLRYSGINSQPDYAVKGNAIKIGSDSGQNDMVINSAAVSKRHARLTTNGGNIFLEDLNSTNGTYVNGEQLTYQEKRLLKKNDKIHFADEMYVLE